MFKRAKEILGKVIYLSKLTEINNKKIRLMLSIVFSNIVVAIDVFVIIIFTSLIGDYLNLDNFL